MQRTLGQTDSGTAFRFSPRLEVGVILRARASGGVFLTAARLHGCTAARLHGSAVRRSPLSARSF